MVVFPPQFLLEVWNIKSSIFAHYILASLSSGVQVDELLFKNTKINEIKWSGMQPFLNILCFCPLISKMSAVIKLCYPK